MHTPTPWHIGMKPGPIAYGPKGEQIADCMNIFLDPKENKANAALIVRAVNSYEAMREALEFVVSRYSLIADEDLTPAEKHTLYQCQKALAEGKE